MADPDDDLIPLPPADLLLPLRLYEEAVTIWRLHWEDDPRAPRRYPTGKYRFDAPAGEYPVTYGNADRLASFAEVYGDRRQILASEAGRRLSLLSAERPLRLVTLDEAETFHALGLDARISTTKRYTRTQAWSLALHHWLPEADGIRYAGRHAGKHCNYCLFLDRCGGDLAVWRQGELQDLRQIVLFAARRYALRAAIPWRAP
jgi:hypothetical protein